MRLETPRLVIRSFEPTDAAGMLAVFGDCGLMLVEGTGPEVEIAYHYRQRSWGQGFGTEAAIARLAHGFGPIGLARVIPICFPENVGSWRVMEKAGMTYEGTGDYCGLTGLKKYVAGRDGWEAPA